MDGKCTLDILFQNVANQICSAVFQAGGLVVVLIEVNRKPYLASLVPVIVNAILNEHQIIVDIVAFVNKGDFPRSRLGEKQRGKLLAGWVTRKLRTLAQFAIRDVDPAAMREAMGGGDDPNAANRASMMSVRSSGGPAGASSLRNVEQAPEILEHEEFEQQMDRIANMTPTETPMGFGGDQMTPTGFAQGEQQRPSTGITLSDPQSQPGQRPQSYQHDEFERYGAPEQPPPVGAKPGSRSGEGRVPPQIRLPGVDGRENVDFWGGDKRGEEDSWEADAIMHMNLTGDLGR